MHYCISIAQSAHKKIREYKRAAGLLFGVLCGYPLIQFLHDQPIDWRIMAVGLFFFVLALGGCLNTNYRLKRSLYATNANEVRDVIDHLQKK